MKFRVKRVKIAYSKTVITVFLREGPLWTWNSNHTYMIRKL
ncbi:hypothetical protein SB48_HM08orf02461 [Heyndrickxia coagulans]|uniref:Uncharacterized protein n=1 Tax=Heyndrickxia coagulans TaxID=1398 RepID=A0AAN0T3U0_HEYCO|nr:hypothetical protein SB48_HM08orf02461 [Heyndrickxia coagulans]